jgi:hypothetical protein
MFETIKGLLSKGRKTKKSDGTSLVSLVTKHPGRRKRSGQKIFGFFLCLPAKFLLFPVRNSRKSPNNSTIFLPGVLLPFSIAFRRSESSSFHIIKKESLFNPFIYSISSNNKRKFSSIITPTS